MTISNYPIGTRVVMKANPGNLDTSGNPTGIGCVVGVVVNSALNKNLYQLPGAGLPLPSNSDLLEVKWTNSSVTTYVAWQAVLSY